MTEQTDAAEVDVRATLLAALNDEYGDQGWDELRSLTRIVRLLAAREAAAEARGAQAALLMAAIEVRVVRENGLPEGVNSHPTSEAFEDWLRARAAVVAARGAEGGAGA